MKTVKEVYQAIDSAAPFAAAMEWDNPGMLVGDWDARITGALVALDVTDDLIAEAVRDGVNLLVTHHPVIFHALKNVRSDSLVYKLVKEGISVICAHTNFDVAAGGVNDVLANLLDLQDVETLPEEGLLRAGNLTRGMTPPEFAYFAKCRLDLDALRYCDGGQVIQRVAVCGGSGGSELAVAAQNGCQAYLTGDVKHDVLLEARHLGITILDGGHFGTETVALERLRSLAAQVLEPETAVRLAKSNLDPSITI